MVYKCCLNKMLKSWDVSNRGSKIVIQTESWVCVSLQPYWECITLLFNLISVCVGLKLFSLSCHCAKQKLECWIFGVKHFWVVFHSQSVILTHSDLNGVQSWSYMTELIRSVLMQLCRDVIKGWAWNSLFWQFLQNYLKSLS